MSQSAKPVADWQPASSPPPDGTICWVSNGRKSWVAERCERASGGWTNGDCWEDFDKEVVMWCPIDQPPPLPEVKS